MIEDLQKKAAQIRVDTLTAMQKNELPYVGSSMSVIEILVSLYYGELFGKRVMNLDVMKPGSAEQDYFILSKGQAATSLYAILADLGFFEKAELDSIGDEGSLLKERPYNRVPGITATINSYGQGLSIALGIALGLKVDRANNKVFAVLGDGELQNGQIWEAAMAASHYNLDNLIAVVDNNKIQSSELISGVMDIGSIQDKFEAFGWNVIKVWDGHNFDQLLDATERAFTSNRKPALIWAQTVASKGIDFAEGKESYHRGLLSSGEYEDVLCKLNQL